MTTIEMLRPVVLQIKANPAETRATGPSPISYRYHGEKLSRLEVFEIRFKRESESPFSLKVTSAVQTVKCCLMSSISSVAASTLVKVFPFSGNRLVSTGRVVIWPVRLRAAFHLCRGLVAVIYTAQKRLRSVRMKISFRPQLLLTYGRSSVSISTWICS